MHALIDGVRAAQWLSSHREDEEGNRFTYRLVDEKSGQTVALFNVSGQQQRRRLGRSVGR